MKPARLLAALAVLTAPALAWQGPLRPPRSGDPPEAREASRQYEDLARIRASIEAGELDRARRELGELQAQGVDALRGSESDEEALHRLSAIDGIAEQLGALQCQLVVRTEIERIQEQLLPVGHHYLLAAKLNLASTRYQLGDLAGAQQLFEHVHAAHLQSLPADHPDVLSAKQGLAITRKALGDLAGAKELEEQVHAARERLLPADHADLLSSKQNLAGTHFALGELAEAQALFEYVHAARERLLPVDHLDLLGAKLNLANVRYSLGDLASAQALYEYVHAASERLLPADHPDLLLAKQNLAATRYALGDLKGAHELNEDVHAARERLLRADHPSLLSAKLNLAATRAELGDLVGAQELEEQVLVARERLLPADHPDLLGVKGNLAATRKDLGDLAGAQKLEEHVHKARERLLPADHPDLLDTKEALAETRFLLGDLFGAQELFEHVHAARERLLPTNHPDLLSAKQNLALVRKALGDLAGAQELFEHVLAAQERLLPADHPDLLRAKQNLAMMRYSLGDLAGAQETFEYVHAVWQRLLPADHPDLLRAKQSLAATRKDLGDLAGAQELDEHVHAARERLLPADHPDLLSAKLNLASTRLLLGELAGAQELIERVHATWERLLPADHPDLLRAKQNVAGVRFFLGESAGAQELFEHVHAVREQLLPADHPDLLMAKLNLAGTRAALGDLSGAQELFEHVHATWEWLLPADHPDLLMAKQNLAVTRNRLGDLGGAQESASGIASGTLAALERALAAAPREARAVALDALQRLAIARTWSRSDLPSTGRFSPYFSALESARFVASAVSLRSLGSSDDQKAPATVEHLRVRAARASLDAHLTAGPGLPDREDEWTDEEFLARSDAAQADWNRELAQLGLARDTAEKEFIQLTRSNSGGLTRIEAERLAAALGEGDVAIGLHRLDCWSWTEIEASNPPTDARYESEYDGEHYIAYTLRSDGSIDEIDLGDAKDIDDRVLAWRAAIGAPIDLGGAAGDRGPIDSRGFGSGRPEVGAEIEAGRALREVLIDPVLSAANVLPGATIHICLDDALHALPLDALPLAAPKETTSPAALRLGDVYRIRNEVSFARVIAPPPASEADPSLLAVGGIHYGEGGGTRDGGGMALEQRVLASVRRGDANELGAWTDLPGTSEETQAIGSYAETALGVRSETLSGGGVTAHALEAAVEGQRFVHIATHGWFMPESVRSMLDHDPSDERMGLLGTERTITGFAPLALCGLVLSGANAAKSNEELAQRLLTAMELASFDLSACELAVLSACETNVGIARAGQGIQSLQSALHQAGARASLTSLWRVDDDATRDLMTAFYSNLWEKKMGKADALWDAKRQLRERNEPVRHWAGWVLVGDPD